MIDQLDGTSVVGKKWIFAFDNDLAKVGGHECIAKTGKFICELIDAIFLSESSPFPVMSFYFRSVTVIGHTQSFAPLVG